MPIYGQKGVVCVEPLPLSPAQDCTKCEAGRGGEEPGGHEAAAWRGHLAPVPVSPGPPAEVTPEVTAAVSPGPPPRFRCPPEFEAAPGGVPMGGPQTELWLIRAPADFCPQSLEGCPVPLTGLERLRPAPPATPDGDDNGDNGDNGNELYVLRGGPAGGGDCPLLLSPLSPGGALGCAPPLRGSLSITRSFGATPGPREGTPRVALGDKGTVPPAEGTEGPGPPREAPEEPRRRKKRKKQKREEGQG